MFSQNVTKFLHFDRCLLYVFFSSRLLHLSGKCKVVNFNFFEIFNVLFVKVCNEKPVLSGYGRCNASFVFVGDYLKQFKATNTN